MASGVSLFGAGVVFTIAMPDNFVLGIGLLAVGAVFFSLAGSTRAPGDGPGDGPSASPTTDSGTSPAP